MQIFTRPIFIKCERTTWLPLEYVYTVPFNRDG